MGGAAGPAPARRTVRVERDEGIEPRAKLPRATQTTRRTVSAMVAEGEIPLLDRLRTALSAAMRARDRPAVAALRTTLAAVANAEAVAVDPAHAGVVGDAGVTGDVAFAGALAGLGTADVPRRELTADDVAAIVRAEAAERRSAAAGYERSGQVERAAALHVEADVLDALLAAP
jgi:uncharacterized protein